MIKGAYRFHEVIIKSQILFNKFIKKNPGILPYSLSTKILYAISTKHIDMAMNANQTIIYVLHCIFSLWYESPEKFKV